MDGFDDLLVPSRNVLEDNPFEDPFAKPRSSSPDPWASFSRQPVESDFQDESLYTSNFDQARSTTPTTESYVTGERGYSEQNSTVDPLEAASLTADDREDTVSAPSERDQTPPRTPGFKPEPVGLTGDEEPALTPSLSRHSPKLSIATSDATSSSPPPPPEPALSPYKPEQSVISPLDQLPRSSLDRPFAGLALGGESLGGWQGDWDNDRPSTIVSAQKVEDDDDDDDKPIGQSSKFKAAERDKSRSLSSATQNSHEIQPVFVISVDDPQRVGDPIRAFTMYTVHTRTTSPLFQKSTFSVLRRYSDFLWLCETLSMNNPGVVVPPVPGKSPFGRFDDQFVEQRRLALEKCIQKTANHPVLGKDPDLKMFLESDTFALDIKHRKAELSQERGGIMASIGQTLAGPRFYETDEWYDKQKTYLDGLESQLRGLVKSIEIVAKQRADLAVATGEFSQTINELSTSDVGKQLQRSLASMADVERKAEQLQHTQSQQDMVTLMSTADEYSRLISSVRLAFNSRIRTYTSWQNADAEVRRIKQNHEKARAQGRIPTDRIGYSLNQLAEVERRALDAKHEFDQCSKLIKAEVARFEQERVEDFKIALQTFLDGMISRQKELIAAWESYQQQLLKSVGGADENGINVN
ncbi:hypothetical protein SERLA73DRAFT_111514 [Serpula lacrymans var. lacrymans S7.3]|uniref:PX domain-containing protein n=1 Tax=Serpula lacrymans var. lacrymans (strain S7.3) TaxID=936435 RepID=F8Q3U9_SERL3|nr:hypothetical protein SERLA73DRAFT_111514 [Serpula lacrymans var. lacrymans S7.3]